ncbi:MAG: hypothetical protein ACI857_000304, partial [Arenicella sp.]
MIKALLFLLSFYCLNLRAQETLQIVRGSVSNVSSQSALQNASVDLFGEKSYLTYTDSLGNFELEVEAGTYTIQAALNSFTTESRSNISIYSGKQQNQNFELQELNLKLHKVIIRHPWLSASNSLSMTSFQRIAGNFYDPGRLVSSYANSINANDQGNGIIVRGASPSFIQWKINNVNVVNPNHLENAGSVNDLPTLNAGGVCLFSAQLLENSTFYYAPTNYLSGNSIGGSFNMNLRNGNRKKYEHILQTSLLGLDFSSEGPLSKNKRASYLVNARYSTVGLLNLIGVDFGGEKINYQDISYKFNFPHKRGQIDFFGVSGYSNNNFTGKMDSLDIENQKQKMNIEYRSITTINGINSSLRINDKSYLKSTFIYSRKNINRFATRSNSSWANITQTDNSYVQQNFSLLNYYSRTLKKNFQLKTGLTYTHLISDIIFSIEDSINVNRRIADPLLEPFIEIRGSIKSKLFIQLGITSLYHARLKTLNLQPKVGLKFYISDAQDIGVNFSSGAQTQGINMYFNSLGENAVPIISNYLSLTHNYFFKKVNFKSEFFFQHFHHIPVNIANNFSVFNSLNESVTFDVISNGEARTYGYDLTLETQLRTFYCIASFSIYDSEYSVNDVWSKARFNSNYNAVLSIGKEFKFKKPGRRWSMDLKGVSRNGFMEADPLSLNQFNYTEQLPPYFRLDMRLAIRKDKRKVSSILSLDIQNLTGRKNE